jgi:hypothetical protein
MRETPAPKVLVSAGYGATELAPMLQPDDKRRNMTPNSRLPQFPSPVPAPAVPAGPIPRPAEPDQSQLFGLTVGTSPPKAGPPGAAWPSSSDRRGARADRRAFWGFNPLIHSPGTGGLYGAVSVWTPLNLFLDCRQNNPLRQVPAARETSLEQPQPDRCVSTQRGPMARCRTHSGSVISSHRAARYYDVP